MYYNSDFSCIAGTKSFRQRRALAWTKIGSTMATSFLLSTPPIKTFSHRKRQASSGDEDVQSNSHKTSAKNNFGWIHIPKSFPASIRGFLWILGERFILVWKMSAVCLMYRTYLHLCQLHEASSPFQFHKVLFDSAAKRQVWPAQHFQLRRVVHKKGSMQQLNQKYPHKNRKTTEKPPLFEHSLTMEKHEYQTIKFWNDSMLWWIKAQDALLKKVQQTLLPISFLIQWWLDSKLSSVRRKQEPA